jgi:ABC-type nitrate/sulfonate/bicarbonate transport system permease component
MRRASWQRLWQGSLTIAAVLLLWQIASNTGIFGRTSPESSRLLLPPPVVVFSSLVEMAHSGYLLDNVSISVLRVVCGFLLAVPLGVMMALDLSIPREGVRGRGLLAGVDYWAQADFCSAH